LFRENSHIKDEGSSSELWPFSSGVDISRRIYAETHPVLMITSAVNARKQTRSEISTNSTPIVISHHTKRRSNQMSGVTRFIAVLIAVGSLAIAPLHACAELIPGGLTIGNGTRSSTSGGFLHLFGTQKPSTLCATWVNVSGQGQLHLMDPSNGDITALPGSPNVGEGGGGCAAGVRAIDLVCISPTCTVNWRVDRLK
jgi:hypothetical protein